MKKLVMEYRVIETEDGYEATIEAGEGVDDEEVRYLMSRGLQDLIPEDQIINFDEELDSEESKALKEMLEGALAQQLGVGETRH